ncbi:MAG TPA: acyltransferase [Verrucomicrobiae bacterium]|nr:acyltransferase [Verrucomicrobiae bacterium]
MIGFLRDKFADVPPGDLARNQLEAVLFWFAGGLPAAPGFLARNVCYRLLFAHLGGFAWVQPGVTIVNAHRLRVGKHFGCNTGTYINAVGGITIGDYVLLGTNVTISSGEHPIDGIQPPIFARPVVERAIVIEDDVWIGANAVVLPGVRVRRGSVIGANAVVNADTAEYSVNVGAPARMIRSRAHRD